MDTASAAPVAEVAEQGTGNLQLPNDELDVRTFTAAGKYKLTNTSYSQLLPKLQRHYTEMPPELRSDTPAFYHNLDLPNTAKADAGDWARLFKKLDLLESVDTDLARPAVVAAQRPHAGNARCRHVGEISLTPVPFHHDIAASLVNPAMSYPVSVRPWRLLPSSRVPGVGTAVPTLVSGNPDMCPARRRPSPFDYNTRWRDANQNIGRRGENHRPRKYQSDQSF
jgi:hypothetical protein